MSLYMTYWNKGEREVNKYRRRRNHNFIGFTNTSPP
jgi:hypothetical protein